jgi:hypothetical protein
MTDFMNQHHDAMISARNAKDYIAKHIMPALMEVGVCEYNTKTKEFHRCQYREAEVKVLQKVRDRKKYLRIGHPHPSVCQAINQSINESINRSVSLSVVQLKSKQQKQHD